MAAPPKTSLPAALACAEHHAPRPHAPSVSPQRWETAAARGGKPTGAVCNRRAPGQQSRVLGEAGGVKAHVAHVRAEQVLGGDV